MSVTSSQILGASTAVGGIAMLPYTGNNPLLEIFQLAFRTSILLLIVVVFFQVVVRTLRSFRKKTLPPKYKQSSLLTKKAMVQLALVYVMVISLVSIKWLDTVVAKEQAVNAKTDASISVQDTDTNTKLPMMGTPSALKIESVGIDLTVAPGKYVDGTWTLSEYQVLHATNTVKPNNIANNTVLYGHNTKAVLEPTKHLQPGDLLILDTQEGYQFTYRYTTDRLVKPDDVSVFDQTATPQLTLITCNGLFNSHRRIMTFEFVSAQQLQ